MSDEPTHCGICNKILNNAFDALSEDCGGDCVLCMAEAGDPDCIDAVKKVATNHEPFLDTEAERICRVSEGNKPHARPDNKRDLLRKHMSVYD